MSGLEDSETGEYLDLLERDREWWFNRAIAGVSVAGGVVTGATLIVGLIRKHYYLTAALLVVLIIGLVAAYLLQRPRKPPKPLIKTDTFRAFGDLDDAQLWKRQASIKDLLAKAAGHGIVLVVGPSGAGKSTLLLRLLPTLLKAAGAKEPILAREREKWPDPPDVKGRIVVLDQFEHALMSLSWDSHSLNTELDELRHEVEALAKSSYAVILGVREDWYVRLAFLQNLLPPLQQSTVLSRLGTTVDNDVLAKFVKHIRGFLAADVTAAAATALAQSAATPLELQASGQLLELARHDPLVRDRADLPDPAGAVEDLVGLVVLRSPNAPVVWKVLHALESVESQGRRLPESVICTATGEKLAAIHLALRYLDKRGLVRRHASGYDLMHDSLVPPIQQLTARHLDPVDRDSIQVAVSDPTCPPHRNETTTRLPWIVMGVIVVMVAVRLLVSDNSLWYAAGSVPLPNRTGGLDPLYAAVAFPHIIWCTYIALHHRRIYQAADRFRAQVFLTYAGTILLVAWVAIGVFATRWWIIAIALGGLFQALKSLQYGADPSRPKAIRRYWVGGGLKTLLNVAIVTAAGLYFALWFPYARFSANTVLAIYWVLSVVLTYSALYLWYQHVSGPASAKYRGLLSRSIWRPEAFPGSRNG